MAGTHTDITDRKQAEEELRASKAELEAALESMTDAVFISDAKGRNFVDFNEAFATFHKFRNKEECAKAFSEYPLFLDVVHVKRRIRSAGAVSRLPGPPWRNRHDY